MLKETDDNIESEQIECLWFLLDLQTTGPLGNASTDLVFEIGRLTGKTVCMIIDHFPEAITECVDDL